LRYSNAEEFGADLRRLQQMLICGSQDLPTDQEVASGDLTVWSVESTPDEKYVLPDLKFNVPAQGELVTTVEWLRWKKKKRQLRSWIGNLMTSDASLWRIPAMIAFLGFVLWRSGDYSDPLARAARFWILAFILAVTGIITVPLVTAYIVFSFLELFEHLPRCKGCRLRMRLTARWTRLCKNREEVIFGYHDCIAALRHRLWSDAAKLLSIYGAESLENKYTPRLVPPAMYCLSFFECGSCGHHAARLTTEDIVEDRWQEQARVEEAYWGSTDCVQPSRLHLSVNSMRVFASVFAYLSQLRSARRRVRA
jgi:hypothetical protein